MNNIKLKFRDNHKFRILMISDLHAGFNYNHKLKDGIEALIKNEDPDFVMIGGDILVSYCYDENHPLDEENVRAFLLDVLEPLIKRNIPWAHVFGNHDNEIPMSKEEQERIFETVPGCVSQRGPESIHGIGNYCLPVYSSSSDEVAYHIWGLDSHRESVDILEEAGLAKDTPVVLPTPFAFGCKQGCTHFDQVMWFYSHSSELEKTYGKKVPEVMFLHVPPIEFCHIARNPEETDAVGSKREEVGCSEFNPGLFFACLERASVKGIFCGHDHLNDFSGKYCGITMGYDAAIGYDMSAHDDLRGGRTIVLDEVSGELRTYTTKLIDIMGIDCFRDPGYFEGGCRYFFRKR